MKLKLEVVGEVVVQDSERCEIEKAVDLLDSFNYTIEKPANVVHFHVPVNCSKDKFFQELKDRNISLRNYTCYIKVDHELSIFACNYTTSYTIFAFDETTSNTILDEFFSIKNMVTKLAYVEYLSVNRICSDSLLSGCFYTHFFENNTSVTRYNSIQDFLSTRLGDRKDETLFETKDYLELNFKQYMEYLGIDFYMNRFLWVFE